MRPLEPPRPHHPVTPGTRGEAGQTTAEYIGILFFLALVLVALANAGLGTRIAEGMSSAVCRIVVTDGCAASPQGAVGTGAAEHLAALEAAEAARFGFVAEYGGRLSELEARARAARQAGDLDGAERLSAQLEYYRRLEAAGVRGPGLVDLVAATDSDFADLVARGTIDLENGKFNTRYFQTEPVLGQGILVYDFFIAARMAATGRFRARPHVRDCRSALREDSNWCRPRCRSSRPDEAPSPRSASDRSPERAPSASTAGGTSALATN